MSVRRGENGATIFYYYGYPDYEEMMFVKKTLQPGDLFVDVGANSGGWSLTSYGLGARSIAIEPVTSSFKRLTYNFDLNKTDKLKAVCVGVSDRDGELFFTTDADAGNRVADSAEGATEKVKVTTLDNLLSNESPALMKIDVEGHELNVLRGATRVLENPSLRALVIETFRWANYNTENLQQIEKLLASKDFRPVGYDPENEKIYDLKPSEGGQNTIYLRGSFKL